MMTMTIMMCNEFQIIDPRWQHRLIFITRLAALAKMVTPLMMMMMILMIMTMMIMMMMIMIIMIITMARPTIGR